MTANFSTFSLASKHLPMESAYFGQRNRQIRRTSRQIPRNRLPAALLSQNLSRRGKMPHLPAPSAGNHATNICIILPEMMQIHHRMMQIPGKGAPLSESAYKWLVNPLFSGDAASNRVLPSPPPPRGKMPHPSTHAKN